MTDRGSDRLLQRTQLGAETAMSPGLSLLSKPLRAGESLVASFKDRSRAVEENKALKEELYALREEKQRLRVMAMKLRRFEQILAVNPDVNDSEGKIAARAVSEIEGPFVRSALINVGRNKGIRKGQAVMAVDGLYGHVLRVGPRSSRVLQLGDLNSRVSVMSMRSEARAILSGNNSEVPRLAFVGDKSAWKENDKVATSGDDGVLPRGLPIGIVKVDELGQLSVILNTTGKVVDWVWVYPFKQIPDPADEDETPSEDGFEVVEGETDNMPEGTP